MAQDMPPDKSIPRVPARPEVIHTLQYSSHNGENKVLQSTPS